MKFSTVALSVVSLAAFVAAQTPATSAPAATVSPSLDPKIEKCLKDCKLENVNCRAECFGAPGPTEEMVKKTTECAAKCDQGDGSPEATQKFADCNNKCIAQYYFSSTLGSAQKTGGNGGSNNGGSGNGDAKPTGSADSGSDNASPSGTGAPNAKDGDSGAAGVRVGGAVAAIAALAFAL